MCEDSQRYFKPLPILILIIVAYTYYAYVYEMCLTKITSTVKKLTYLIIYHLLLIFMLIHYFMGMCIWPGYIPDKYRFSKSYFYAIKSLEYGDPKICRMLESFCASRGIRTYLRKNSCIRYCLKCKLVKPDRTHHCSSCKKCILKMDHHCPWMDNCVGFTNYKIYLLLLVHSIIYCTFYAGTSLEYVYILFARGSKRMWWEINYVIGCCVALVVVILLAVLLACHCSAVLTNETTIETLSDYEIVDNCSFDLGKLDNVLEVCGYNWCLWCLPVHTSLGDGVEFPVICP